jgi:hypothetical protein
MPAYVVAPEADRDIFEIWRYLAIHAGVDIADASKVNRMTLSNRWPDGRNWDTGAQI